MSSCHGTAVFSHLPEFWHLAVHELTTAKSIKLVRLVLNWHVSARGALVLGSDYQGRNCQLAHTNQNTS